MKKSLVFLCSFGVVVVVSFLTFSTNTKLTNEAKAEVTPPTLLSTFTSTSTEEVSRVTQPPSPPLSSSTHPVVKTAALPLRVMIPSIELDSPIQNVGTNEKGEMGVPSGKTNKVGWYKDGTIPGNVGSAVFAAHVFAAFTDLNKVRVGDDIYVQTDNNTKLHFVVVETSVLPLAEVSAERLFEKSDIERLNIITCAGKLTPDRETYDHRLIVYTKLVK